MKNKIDLMYYVVALFSGLMFLLAISNILKWVKGILGP